MQFALLSSILLVYRQDTVLPEPADNLSDVRPPTPTAVSCVLLFFLYLVALKTRQCLFASRYSLARLTRCFPRF